jgi:hypothetical protein
MRAKTMMWDMGGTLILNARSAIAPGIKYAQATRVSLTGIFCARVRAGTERRSQDMADHGAAFEDLDGSESDEDGAGGHGGGWDENDKCSVLLSTG